MNNLVPAGPAQLADLEFAPAHRFIPQPTPLERLNAGIYRQRLPAALIFILALAIGALLTFGTAPRYTATASVQLEQLTPRVIAAPELDPQPNVQDADRFLQTQIDRVRSRNLAQIVANQLRIGASPALMAALGVDPNAPGRNERIIASLQDGVAAELGLNTRLAQIAFTSRHPEASARIANAFAEALAATNLNSKIETSNRAKQYLQGQLGAAKNRLETSEKRMLAYARSADLTTTVVPGNGDKDDRGGSLRAQQLGLMAGSLSQATARRIDAEQSWNQVRGASAMSLPDVQGNRAIQDLVSQRAQLQAAYNEERQRHTDAYPSVRETAAKINVLDSQIGGLAGNIKNSFYGRYVAAAQQERQMAGSVGQLRGAAMAERERSVRYNSLNREVETNKAFYEGLLQRYREVAAASGAPAVNVTVVDRASAPLEPSSPDVPRNLALAGIAGAILALMAGSTRERMHHVVRSAEDLESNFGLPTLGVVPLLTGRKTIDEALDDPRSAQSEAYNSVAVALGQGTGGIVPKTLLVTSSTVGEGKSTSAVGLARSLASMGLRVLLVDGDLRRPSLRKIADGMDSPGLSDALAGSAPARSIIRRADLHDFDVVGAGQAATNPMALLSAGHMDKVIDGLAEEHDIVVIDAPPVMGLADAVLLARNAAAVLLVTEANRTHLCQVEVALSRLSGANIIGSIITKFDPRAAGVSYGGTDYYSY